MAQVKGIETDILQQEEDDVLTVRPFFDWRNPLFWVVMILISALIIVSSYAFFRPAPTSTVPGNGSAEVEFARMMSAHHEQAVEMALIIRERSDNEELRTLALDIILTQQQQIGQMQGWLSAWGQPWSGRDAVISPEHAAHMGMATQQEVNSLNTLELHEAEAEFLRLMIRHHQGAIPMAEEVLTQTKRPEVARLANSIIQSQAKEITAMEHMLSHYNSGEKEETNHSHDDH